MKHRIITSAGLAALLVLVTLSGVAMAAPQPDNYCTTVNVEATTSGYDVTATGAGRYARVRDLTVNATVVATDFGAGATQYSWTGLALDQTHQYQVQVSHTSLTTGYSTSGCLFTPPEPQAVVVVRFEWINYGFEWDVTQDGAGYWIVGPHFNSGFIPAQAPGNWGYYSYRYAPWARIVNGVYDLWAMDVDGRTGIVATLTKGGATK